jgi:hypothetical protein
LIPSGHELSRSCGGPPDRSPHLPHQSPIGTVATEYLSTLEETMAKAGKTIEIDEEALDLIAAEGYSVAFGARFLKRVIDERIKLPITMHWNDGSHFRVQVASRTIVVNATSGDPQRARYAGTGTGDGVAGGRTIPAAA